MDVIEKTFAVRCPVSLRVGSVHLNHKSNKRSFLDSIIPRLEKAYTHTHIYIYTSTFHAHTEEGSSHPTNTIQTHTHPLPPVYARSFCVSRAQLSLCLSVVHPTGHFSLLIVQPPQRHDDCLLLIDGHDTHLMMSISSHIRHTSIHHLVFIVHQSISPSIFFSSDVALRARSA